MHLIKFPSIYSEIGCVLNKAPAKWNFRQAKLQKSLVCLRYACTKSYKICRFLTEIFQKKQKVDVFIATQCKLKLCHRGVFSYCFDCDQHFCAACSHTHSRIRALTDHKMLQLHSPARQANSNNVWSQHQWRRNYGDRGAGHCTPQVQDLYPLYLPSQRCGLCHNFKQTTLTTRLYNYYNHLTASFPGQPG